MRVRPMAIHPEDFFSAATALNQSHPPLVSDEVCARTMAGRMYYAAYLATRDALRAQFRTPSFDITHAALAFALIRAHDSDVQSIGARLQALRRLRERADYKPHHHITRAAAAIQLANARFVLDNVGRLVGRFPPVRRR